MTVPKLTTGQEFRGVAILRFDGAQFRINDAATVRVRVKSNDGETALTTWQAHAKNDQPGTDWGLSTIEYVIAGNQSDTITDYGTALLEINISGQLLDRDETLITGATYEKSWESSIKISKGLA